MMNANMNRNPSREEIMNQKQLHKDAEQPVKQSPKIEMERVFAHYLASNPAISITRKKPELEIRFQGIGGAPLTKIDYDSVIQHLYAAGFTSANTKGIQILRVMPEYVDERKGITKISNIRAEITGVDLIQEYCKTNSIQHLLNLPSTLSAAANKIVFSQKTQIPVDPKMPQEKFRPVDNNDFRFRVGYQYENEFGPNSELVRGMIETKRWADSKKVFRHLNRVRFEHKDLPIFADVTILHTSAKSGKVMVPQYTIQDAKVFQESESYEVELELDNSRIGSSSEYNTAAKLLEDVRKAIRIVLSAIQGTNYPVGEQDMKRAIHCYKRIVLGHDEVEQEQCSFIGPSSRTLQMENIVSEQTSVPNLRDGYTVTDKADGERKMLLIDDTGKLYFIDMNMRIQFTGTMTAEKKLHFSLFDGEHIKYDKTGRFVNIYAIFDVYFVNKKSTREFAFAKTSASANDGEPAKPIPYRKTVMTQAVEMMKPFSILDKDKPKQNATNKPESSPCAIRVQCKEFYVADETEDIFAKCGELLSKMRDGLFEYNTDGLIFTPAKYGVGGGPNQAAGPLYKHTWDRSFKWKPAEFNTIDFLVRMKKDANGRDVVSTEFENGVDLGSDESIKQYKTIVLHCGFDERIHGYLNPFQQLLDGAFAKKDEKTNEDEEVGPKSTYSARPFSPTNPADPKACLCNVPLAEGGSYMRTEEGDVFEENMIVEFRYAAERKGAWRWVPLRVRYDKTAQMSSLCGGSSYRKKKQSFGNDFTTANSNWFSIHNPITEHMLSTGSGIQEIESVGEDVYYNRKTTDSTTRGLRDFHNLYVKMRLINGAGNRKDTLIDFAVGKAGDLSKWRSAKLRFVLGIDVSKDNIMNRVDGACARYLTEASKFGGMFDALFLHGNSAQNIRGGEAFDGYKEKMVAKAIFGEGPKVRADLGETVYKSYGIAQEGFNISSCQFALHYFFENVRTMHNFVRNVAECTRVGGVFVGTCWDGKTVFNLLRNKPPGDAFTMSRYGNRIFQITKMYDYTAFPDSELSLGYSVSVFQESIGQHIVEYLVNFDFFRRVMENYGFVLLGREEATQFGFPNGGTGMFDGLYYDMMSEVSRNPTNKYGTAPEMTEDERFISFLNRYFVFRKVRHVAAEKITRVIEDKMPVNSNKKESDETEAAEIGNIAKSLDKRAQISARGKKPVATEAPHFIRPLGDKKLTIQTFDPLLETVAKIDARKSAAVEEIVDLPISDSGPSIQLVPNAIRIGKQVRIPTNKIKK